MARRKQRSPKAEAEPKEGEVLPAEESEETPEPGKLVGELEELGAVQVLPPEEELKVDEPEAPEAETKEIVPYDSLRAYLREISQFPRLTKEEEHEIALRYHKNKDIDAAYKLVSSNLWLVVKISREYERAARNVLDLIQEGSIGLMEAVKSYDPYRGVRFPSYAVWWIRAYIIRYVIANWRMVKIGTTQAQRKLFFNLQKEKERLEREGFYPGPKLLADRLNVREKDVVEMEQRLGSSDLSVDAPLQSDSDNDLLSLLPASESTQEDLLAKKELRELLAEKMDQFSETLNEKELAIFRERMLSEEKATLQDLAEKLNLSRERVRQIEVRIGEKLKKFFEEQIGGGIDTLDL